MNWRRPPRALHRPGVRLDNIALVPASLLPRKAQYQAIADRLPSGEVLLVLPPAGTPERTTMEQVARLFRARGRHLTVLSEARVRAAARP